MLDQNGHEVLDQTPIAVPLQFRQRSYFDQVKEFIRAELSRQAADQGHETFEEADDFDVGDDYDPRSPWELSADQEGFFEEVPANQKPQQKAQSGDLSTDPPSKAGAVGKSGSPDGTGTTDGT